MTLIVQLTELHARPVVTLTRGAEPCAIERDGALVR